MGGGAFLNARADGHATLQTPRLSPEEYTKHRDSFLKSLSDYFGQENIICLLEAPGKTDYGDIDIDISHDGLIDWADVASAIGATAYLDRGSEKSQKCSFAIRLDGHPAPQQPTRYTLCSTKSQLQRKDSTNISEEAYVQLDLKKTSPELKLWTAFYGSYGDLAGMLGNAVTNFGFDVTDRGLRLRLQELDDSGHGEWEHFRPALEDCRMMLSSDPSQIMQFFGLDVERYHAGFESELDLFQWLAQCRMISEYSLKRERNEISRDKQKVNRPMFTRFFKEWLPAYLEGRKRDQRTSDGLNDINAETSLPDLVSPTNEHHEVTSAIPATTAPQLNPDQTTTEMTIRTAAIAALRTQYLHESLSFFDAISRYETLHTSLLINRATSTAVHKLRPILATHSGKKGPKLAELVRAFRRNVGFCDGKCVILGEPRRDDDSLLGTLLDESGLELRDVEGWVGENFERVKEVERGRGKGIGGGGGDSGVEGVE
ncbi:hypothetical protein Q7P37_000346 [Cladosporium fusiforme]